MIVYFYRGWYLKENLFGQTYSYARSQHLFFFPHVSALFHSSLMEVTVQLSSPLSLGISNSNLSYSQGETCVLYKYVFQGFIFITVCHTCCKAYPAIFLSRGNHCITFPEQMLHCYLASTVHWFVRVSHRKPYFSVKRVWVQKNADDVYGSFLVFVAFGSGEGWLYFNLIFNDGATEYNTKKYVSFLKSRKLPTSKLKILTVSSNICKYTLAKKKNILTCRLSDNLSVTVASFMERNDNFQSNLLGK